eukprot:CAMPEP_0182872014 /NCGR_PEP_ID=MMETSP0034_2-20130328/11458_1 /TAXON_ID=156128 /ORGANISM="Nephroselmis pyriformis, Strain CCMP717" /LENGTH=46 /DNA_ID= /DNA_START= /DNA_END= /DNA_ORIENTATION=
MAVLLQGLVHVRELHAVQGTLLQDSVIRAELLAAGLKLSHPLLELW